MGIAAIIALITQFTPLIPAIKGMIQGAENTVGGGGGGVKKATVVEAIVPFAKILKEKGIIPADIDVEAVGTLVDVLVSTMKGAKELDENKTSGVENLGLQKGVAYPMVFSGEMKGTVKLAVQP